MPLKQVGILKLGESVRNLISEIRVLKVLMCIVLMVTNEV